MPLLVFFFLRYNYSFKALISTFTWAVLKAIPSPERDRSVGTVFFVNLLIGDMYPQAVAHFERNGNYASRFVTLYIPTDRWANSICVHIEGPTLTVSLTLAGHLLPARKVRMRDANTQRKRNENTKCQNSNAPKRAKRFRAWWSHVSHLYSWIIYGSTCRTLFDFCWVMNTKALQSGPLLLMIKI